MPAFIDNVSAAVEAFGVDKVGLIWGVGITPWESEEQRDDFLRIVAKTGEPKVRT